jgi:palmitoyltransferase
MNGPNLVAAIWVTVIHFLVIATCAWYDPSLVNMTLPRGWVSLLLLIGSLYFLFRSAVTDPGIVKSNAHNGATKSQWTQEDSATEMTSFAEKDEDYSDGHVNLRFCDKCNILQPLRSKHCPEINACVRTHDHYCQWISNCVGENNRVLFATYLIFETSALAWFTINSFMKIAEKAETHHNQLASFAALILAITVMCIFWLMTSLLTCYHIFLACANLTTWEQTSWKRISYLQDLSQAEGSPFSRPTIIENLRQYFRVPGSVEVDSEGGIIWRLGPQKSVIPGFCSCINEF